MTDIPFTFTSAAVTHIQAMIAKEQSGVDTAGLRLALKIYGCSGLGYDVQVVEKPGADDLTYLVPDAFALFVDPECLEKVSGTQVDYVGKDLGQKQLIFENPRASGACGCGESFIIEEDNRE